MEASSPDEVDLDKLDLEQLERAMDSAFARLTERMDARMDALMAQQKEIGHEAAELADATAGMVRLCQGCKKDPFHA